MNHRHAALGFVVIVAGALTLSWWTRDRAPQAAPPASAAATEVPGKVAAPPPARARATTGGDPLASNAALPRGDTPLPELLVLLQPRADTGDSLAACRLGVELLRCEANDFAVRFHQSHSTGFIREKEAQGQLALANHVEEQQLRQLELQIQCRQLPEDVRRRGSDYLIQAARAGEPEAMLRYALGEHWGINLDDFLADGRFDVWRREAPDMLQRALEGGDPRSVNLLMSAYLDDFSPHSGLVANDPVRGLAFQILHFRLTSRPPPTSRLGAADVVRAEALATELHRRHFGNRRLESAEQAFLAPLFSAGSDGRDPGFCRHRGT
jgi:hypothetical protein